MRNLITAMLIGGALSACHGSGGGSGPVTAPTAPSGPSGAPPAVNVGGAQSPDGFLAWNGQVSWDGVAAGSNTLQLQLSQTGSHVSGKILVFGPNGTGGPFAGTVSGNTLSFNFSVGNQDQGCGNAISGTATVGTNTMTATFSGHDCRGAAITNGMFAVSVVPPNAAISTTRFPVAGTWKGDLPAVLGAGTSTWVLSQDGDVNGGNLTGSVTITGNNTLKLGSGSVTGTVTNNFPGPPWDVSVTMNVSFTGACPSTMTLPTTYNGTDGQTLTAGYRMAGFSGTTCNGPLSPFGFNIQRQ